ncbi:AAA family ATPase [Myxococcota bacterium]
MIIAVIGKGGVGKTTVTALLLRSLVDCQQTPVLAVDADPSACLGATLGIGVDKTLGELRDKVRIDSERPEGMAKVDWLGVLAEDAISEQQGFDLLTMGHPEGPGCYCFVNNLLRDHLQRLARAYRHVLVDCEAGQEHLSRRTAQAPDLLVCVMSRSRMAADTIRRSLLLFDGLHGRLPQRLDLVLNGFDQDALEEELVHAATGGSFRFAHTWRVPHDPAVSACDASGRSLFDLASDAPALVALAPWAKSL